MNADHWSWIQGLIAQAEAHAAPALPVRQPAVERRPSRDTAGRFVPDNNVISMTRGADCMVTVLLRQNVAA